MEPSIKMIMVLDDPIMGLENFKRRKLIKATMSQAINFHCLIVPGVGTYYYLILIKDFHRFSYPHCSIYINYCTFCMLSRIYIYI